MNLVNDRDPNLDSDQYPDRDLDPEPVRSRMQLKICIPTLYGCRSTNHFFSVEVPVILF